MTAADGDGPAAITAALAELQAALQACPSPDPAEIRAKVDAIAAMFLALGFAASDENGQPAS